MNASWLARSAGTLRNEVLKRAHPTITLRGPPPGTRSTRSQHTASQDSNLPRFVQPSIWDSIIPRSLRNRSKRGATPETKKASNPANYFIWIYIFIGSQAIRILGLKNEFNTYTRKADLKLATLREVVGKLQRGEEVDVEKALGTGDEVQEREWEEAIRELESEERLWQKSKMRQRAEEERVVKEHQDANPVNGGQEGDTAAVDATTPAMAPRPPGFY